MDRVFTIGAAFRVPDATLVSPLLNPLDTLSGLPLAVQQGFSIAAGTIEAGSRSKIHLMPHVTQATFVRRGKLHVRMKGPRDAEPYDLIAHADQAVLTLPNTLLQLINDESEPCEALYIVSPSYIFEMAQGYVMYDDAVVLEEEWDGLRDRGWQSGVPIPTLEQRWQALARLTQNPIAARKP